MKFGIAALINKETFPYLDYSGMSSPPAPPNFFTCSEVVIQSWFGYGLWDI